MTVTLRPYQADLKRDVYVAWETGARNVLAVAPTGAGKTVLFADVIREHNGASIAIAHRHELVGQISKALARDGVRHRIIGQQSLIRDCVATHMREVGKSYYDANARCAVASVNTLVRMNPNDPWFRSVTLWVQDETHHLLAENLWGKAVAMFPNAKGLGVSATPLRADGKGLGRHADGVMDDMVEAPNMRALIDMGYLSDYRIFAPPSDLDVSNVPTAASGDYSPDPLREAIKKSHITGDVVEHYLRIAKGKRGVTFCAGVESASEIAAAFRAAGVPAETVSAETAPAVRSGIIRKFAAGEILQLTNADIFAEGFDLPAIEVVSMARPTQSFALFSQQFGRALRIMDGKPHAIIIDHVNNTRRHGLPDKPRVWSLDRRERRTRGTPADVIAVRTCPKCYGTYERVVGLTCPYCGEVSVPVSRSGPEHVDGVLAELDEATLSKMRGEVDAPASTHPDRIIQATINKRHREKSEAQLELRAAIAQWAGGVTQGTDAESVAMMQRKFYLTFGVDVLSAQALSASEADELRERITRSVTP